ncbi:unnamed protein product [Rotaria magnacalcarata]|uniref:Uncharacterized protein n=1 Tax=Rotaria magnacalcarata TaxID=392030 RepID=A0A818XLE2_9BILA|nr:unnamed protein product [Rotaria magnacalcarata]CAF4028651.1 unnamed protein product [Rotaria magnacalcarata]CAF4029783.1 unnamed protein product [Rotaria magnacalcarata]CAF4111875.1 unnamed protein product [Rotaria magnacalcarata]CAF4999227.1 unnamed protein product [Rotaria magnacalcarata]
MSDNQENNTDPACTESDDQKRIADEGNISVNINRRAPIKNTHPSEELTTCTHASNKQSDIMFCPHHNVM